MIEKYEKELQPIQKTDDEIFDIKSECISVSQKLRKSVQIIEFVTKIERASDGLNKVSSFQIEMKNSALTYINQVLEILARHNSQFEISKNSPLE